MTDESARFVGTIPQFYDENLGPILFSDFGKDLAARAAAAKPDRILETAAGTGIVTRHLRDALPAGTQLIATDLNEPMLQVSRDKFRPSENVVIEAADATALPYPEGSFDAAVCQFGVMFFPDQAKSHGEIFRILKPGGLYVFNVWDSHGHNPFGRIAHETVRSFFPVDTPQFYQVPFSCHAIDPLKEGLLQAGFRGLAIELLSHERSIPDVTQFARGFVFGNPLLDQVKARGGNAQEVADTLAANFLREFGDKPGRMPLQAIVFQARKPG